MTSLGGPKNQSTHGRVLLTELRDRTSARLDFVLECLQKDPLSGRLKCTETGNTAYHWLLIGNYPVDFTSTVLSKLLEVCPQGVRTVNNNGSLPLHLSLTANRLCQTHIDMLLTAYPAGAGIADTQGLIPLFLCCMREDATADICKALCKAFPNGPTTKNKTNSYPLHFAAKRKVPNLDILRILIRRNPAAAGAVNDFGLLPMHCITALSDNVQAVELIHSADESAVKVRDRQGRTCLHLAVLHMGREHSGAVQLEEEEQRLQAQLEAAARDQDQPGGGRAAAEVDWGSDDSDTERATSRGGKGQKSELIERDGGSRGVIRFLVSAYPQALCLENNFHATPVETVLEKVKPQRTKNKIVSIYGLYDDPPTARLLLSAQRNRSRAFNEGKSIPVVLPNLRPRLIAALREFNWAARRDALVVSLLGEPRYCELTTGGGGKDKKSPQSTVGFIMRFNAAHEIGAAVALAKKSSGSSAKAGGKAATKVATKKTAKSAVSVHGADAGVSAGIDACADVTTVFSALQIADCAAGEASACAGSTSSSSSIAVNTVSAAEAAEAQALRGNCLARLRRRGLEDVVRTVLAFI